MKKNWEELDCLLLLLYPLLDPFPEIFFCCLHVTKAEQVAGSGDGTGVVE